MTKEQALAQLSVYGAFGRFVDELAKTERGEQTVEECYDELWRVLMHTGKLLASDSDGPA